MENNYLSKEPISNMDNESQIDVSNNQVVKSESYEIQILKKILATDYIIDEAIKKHGDNNLITETKRS